MSAIFYLGVVVTLIGLVGILWFIRRARRLKQADLNPDATQAEFRALVVLNMASVGLAFLGLAITVVGLILA